MHVDCGLQTQHLCTDEFEALFKPNLQHSTVMIKWMIPGLSFALPLPFDTLSIHQKMTFKRRFQYWTCAAPPCNEKHQMKQNSHISSEQIRFQAMQCFSSTCYPLQILMHRDMRDRNLPPTPGICLEVEPGPSLCPGHGLPGWWASKYHWKSLVLNLIPGQFTSNGSNFSDLQVQPA